MEGKMGRHWICYVEGTDGGRRFPHPTLESASTEAKRLARLPNVNGKKVHIYEWLGACQVSQQPITWELPS